MDLNDVHDMTRFDSRLGMEHEEKDAFEFSELHSCVDGVDSDGNSGNMRRSQVWGEGR